MQNKYKWNETNYKTITSAMFAHIFIYTSLSVFSLQCFLWLPPHTLLKGAVPEACAENLLNQFNLRAAVLHPAYRERCCVQCWRDT